jgi:chromatin remodeling complex protein RSC6
MTENLVIDVTAPPDKVDVVPSNVVDEIPDETLESSLKDLSDIAVTLKSEVTTLQQKIKQIEKLVKQDKKKKSQEPKLTKKKLSGFALPMPISDDLCKFMKKTTGSKVARTDVTKYLVKYVKDQKLEDENNHRIICPNKELSNLLSSREGDEVTYFNLQTYINHHFKVKPT